MRAQVQLNTTTVRKNVILENCLLFFILALYLVGCIWIYRFEVDDTFISLRYARNLADYGVLAFNPGDNPVEGYTNFLLVLIEALFIKLGVKQAEMIPQIVGIISGFLAIWTTHKLSKKLIKSEAEIMYLLPSVALAASTPFIVWSTAGLETVLFSSFILGAIYNFVNFIDTGGSKPLYYSNLLFILGILCRPEGILFWLFGYIFIFFYQKQGKIQIIKSLLVSMTLLVSYFTWKYFYFGDLLPTSFYAKYGMLSFFHAIKVGLEKYAQLLTINLNILYFIFLIYVMGNAIKRKTASFIYITGLFVLYSLYVISIGTAPMDFAYRYFVPILSLLYILGISGISHLFEWMKIKYKVKYGILTLLCVLQVGFGVYQLDYYWNTDIGFYDRPVGMAELVSIFDKERDPVAKWLAEKFPPGSSIATGDIGRIGYYSNLRVIDTYSLIDKNLLALRREQAKNQMNRDKVKAIQKEMVKYVLDQNPAAVCLLYLDFSSDPRAANYVLFNSQDLNYLLFIRKDLVGGQIPQDYPLLSDYKAQM